MKNELIDNNGAAMPDRRQFLKNTGLALAATTLLPGFASAALNVTHSVKAGHRMLGNLEVSAPAMGCMELIGVYGPKPDKKQMIGLVHAAVDRGITYFDSAQAYGMGTDEEVLGEALKPYRNKVVIASKFGFNMESDEPNRGPVNSDPKHIRKVVELSLKRLQTDVIDLMYQHRVDPNVPMEDVAGTIKDLIKEGKIKHFGMCEASEESIRKAHAVQPVSALQSEYNLLWRGPEKLFSILEELGIGLVTWCPLAAGLLTGAIDENKRFAADDARKTVPRLFPDNLKANMQFVRLAQDWAKRKEITPAQFSLAWLMAQKPFIVPIPGTTNVKHMEENFAAANVKFSATEMHEIDTTLSAMQVKGERLRPDALKLVGI